MFSKDEQYWEQIANDYFNVSPDFINLENGYYGVQAKPVFEAFQKNLAIVNTELSRFARRDYPDLFVSIRKELADFLQVSPGELLITRNATESLNIAIQGYPFRQGDEVIISQLDFPSMIEVFRMLEKKSIITVKTIQLPLLPLTEQELIDAYVQAITPRTRVILLTQVSNITGLILPVKAITEIARSKNIDTMVDAAHALGHIPFDITGIGSDFVGMNLHKWIGNPIGAGVLYIKKERIREMQRFWGDVNAEEDDILKLGHYGTTEFAVMMTIPQSLYFHNLIGIEHISSRLHYLKTLWTQEFIDHPTIRVLTPVNRQLSCGIASFAVKDWLPSNVSNYLFEKHRIFTMPRDTITPCIRVTPSIYNSKDDMMALVGALKEMIGNQK